MSIPTQDPIRLYNEPPTEVRQRIPVPEGLGSSTGPVPPVTSERSTVELAHREAAAAKFARLKREWLAQGEKVSGISNLVLLPPYQKIMAMGKEAIPSLFRELKSSPNHWFWALEMILEVNPVPEEDYGDIRKMADAWLDWASQHGFSVG